MSEVNGPIPFIATWGNEPKTYDPRTEGHFAVVNLSGGEIDLGIGEFGYKQRLSLSYGSVGTPWATIDQAVADLALTVARFPEAESKLSIVKLPCVFSSRDGWIAVDYAIPEGIAREAATVAEKDSRFNDRFYRDQFERKYKLR
jgi:hypothetical protein